jgi:YVTN family beta-propeller protein
MKPIAGPVYGEYNATTNQLVVADYDGGTISVIDVSLDEFGNDSPTFGTTYTIAVGQNPATVAPYPASVTVLADGSRAYSANQGEGTVTIVNLSSHTVETTLPVTGHPRSVVSTSNSLYGKVYVVSPDSPYLTILRTDQDIVDATVLVQGNILDVRVTSTNGSGNNNNNVSRRPGVGQPCYLAPTDPRLPNPPDLASCQALPLP